MSAHPIPLEVRWPELFAVGPRCVEFRGSRNDRGYGQVKVDGRMQAAHRVAWSLKNDRVIPDGLTVDHICFNTSCVNPEHLRLLTNSANARRQRSALKTHCANGHEYTPENTYRRPSTGGRDCLTCIRARKAAFEARRKAS